LVRIGGWKLLPDSCRDSTQAYQDVLSSLRGGFHPQGIKMTTPRGELQLFGLPQSRQTTAQFTERHIFLDKDVVQILFVTVIKKVTITNVYFMKLRLFLNVPQRLGNMKVGDFRSTSCPNQAQTHRSNKAFI